MHVMQRIKSKGQIFLMHKIYLGGGDIVHMHTVIKKKKTVHMQENQGGGYTVAFMSLDVFFVNVTV